MRPPRLPGADSKQFLANLPGDTLRPKIPVDLQYQTSHDLMVRVHGASVSKDLHVYFMERTPSRKYALIG